MLYKAEIDQKAKEFEIHSSNVERDYVFGWILHGIFTISDLKDTIFLKGGNALRKGYFENTRFSKDLDLGIPGDIDQDKLLAEINKVCDFIQDKAQIIFDKDLNQVKEKFTNFNMPLPDLKVYEVRLHFQDFYGKKSSTTLRISLDLTRFDKVIAPIQTVKLIHPYSDSDAISCEIRCMKLEELIATKVKCLLQRQHTPDLFDYAYSIKLLGGSLNKEEVSRMLIQKTIFGRNPHVLKDILKNISLAYFREYWSKTIVCTKETMVEVEEAITIFLLDLENLFSIYSDTGYRDFAFFEANLRTPIMDAGRNQTLLKVRYKDSDRLVEPYALKYQERRDGRKREYLYVYNVTGGDNPPGIRQFVAENVQSIENTDQKFVPRDGQQIELSKAGELPENPYLFDPNKPVNQPRSEYGHARTRNPYGIKYIYRCGVCGKSFTKSTSSSKLGKHKSKNGYPCFNGYGIYLGTKN
jgi:predicted nucleotidyltransferase component of viral defense system